MSVQPSIQAAFEKKLLSGLESRNKALFRLAAETRLSRRLNKLLRVNEKISIDTSYVSCAEYQLFIDEQYQQNRFYQPDHWLDNRFSYGMATNPIVGIRPTDAQAFCKWLSSRTGLCYRLPNQDEIQVHKIVNNNAGTWILDSDRLRLNLLTFSKSKLQHWHTSVHSSLLHFMQRDFEIARKTYPSLSFNLKSVLKSLLARVSKHDIDLADMGDLNRVSILAHKLDLSLSLKHALDHNRSFTIARDQERKRSLQLEQQRDFDLDLDLGLANARILTLISKIDAAREKVDSLQELMRQKINDTHMYAYATSSENAELDNDLKKALEHARQLSTTENSENEYIKRQKRKREKERERSKELNEEADKELSKVLNQFINNDLNLAQSIATAITLDKKLLKTLEKSFVRAFNLKSTCMGLLMYLTVWEILIRFYEQSSSSQRWLSFNREKYQITQDRKEECIQNFNSGLSVYVFYSIVSMRKLGSLPAWESIQLVGEVS